MVLGSSLAMLVSAVVNSTLNQSLGRMLKKNNFASFAFRSYVSTGVGQFIDNLVFAIVVSHTFFGWTWVQVLMLSLIHIFLEALVADEPTNADRFDLLIGAGGKGGGGHDGAQYGERGKRDGQGAIYN